MSASRLEALLAQIYVDGEARARFLADPTGVALKAGLTTAEAEALARIVSFAFGDHDVIVRLDLVVEPPEKPSEG